MEKKEYISILSVISSLAVVILHTNGCFWTFSYNGHWPSANVIESVMYFAVPIFFMISGATLIDYNERYDLKTYLKKRFIKTVIPFITWSMIGLLYRILEGAVTVDDINVSYLIDGIFNASFVGIYWFFIPLFSVYLSIPILSSIEKGKRKEVFSYIVIVILIFNTIPMFLIRVLGVDIRYNSQINIYIGYGYLFYVIIGYLISNYEIKKMYKNIIYIMSALGLLMQLIGTYCLSMEEGNVVQTYKGYLNLPCILYSVGIFLFFKEHGKKILNNSRARQLINLCQRHTFSVYLMHWFIMQLIIKLFKINQYSILYRVGFPFIIFGICMLISVIVKKIPLVRKILP